MDDAVKALSCLSKVDMTEVSKFSDPPPALVVTTMECVCLLMGVEPSWAESKKLLNDVTFLHSLVEYDKDSIDEKVLQKLQKCVFASFSHLCDFVCLLILTSTRSSRGNTRSRY